ncbi:hypothetical protein [Cohnella luojiensis]|nr:hypothetical protein [Cohnella luojiensis]
MELGKPTERLTAEIAVTVGVRQAGGTVNGRNCRYGWLGNR